MIDQYQRAEDLDELAKDIINSVGIADYQFLNSWLVKVWQFRRETAGMDEDELEDRYGRDIADAVTEGLYGAAVKLREQRSFENESHS